jgi:hypothetical protein
VSNIEQTYAARVLFNKYMTMAEQWRELFQIADTKRSCPSCDVMPTLVRLVLDPRTGKTVRMFEFKCGKHGWCD